MEPAVQRYAVDLVRRTRAHTFFIMAQSSAAVALLLAPKLCLRFAVATFNADDSRRCRRCETQIKSACRAELEGPRRCHTNMKSAEVPNKALKKKSGGEPAS